MQSETFSNGTAAGGTLTLSKAAARVIAVTGLVGGATSVAATSATIGTSAPTGTGAQFTGTAQNPSASVVLGTGWAANSIVTVTYDAAGSTPSNK